MKINVGLWHGSSTTRRLTEVRHPAGLGWQAASLPSEARGFTSLLNHFLKLLTDYRSVKTIDGDVNIERVCV
jgi:hypothetical protein